MLIGESLNWGKVAHFKVKPKTVIKIDRRYPKKTEILFLFISNLI